MNISTLPKAELHCHIDGLVDPEMLKAIAARGHQLPLTVDALQAAYPVQGFDDFTRWCDTASAVEGPTGHFKWILAEHIERLKAQKVVYAEIMLGTSELPREDGDLLDQFSAFREYVNDLEGSEIQIEFLLAIWRSVPTERFERLAAQVMRLRKADLLFGIALAGWPEVSIRPLGLILARLHDAGIGIEIHAGEWCGPEMVWDALNHGCPDRIGHGVALFQDARLVERFQRDQIHIEMCPVSNLKTGSVARIEDHPIRLARDWGLNFSVNTDDPGPFENSMESEYQLLVDLFGFERQDFERIYQNSLAARFQPRLRYLQEV
jgi:adenosine deaminase